MAQQVSRDAKPISCHRAVRASKCPHHPPPVPPLHTVTRHLGLSCKCSAQEWERVTQSSCPTWCETQLELCFVPTGHPQKTKQETCLMWLFSTPHPHPPQKCRETSLVRAHMGNLPTASRSHEVEPREL